MVSRSWIGERPLIPPHLHAPLSSRHRASPRRALAVRTQGTGLCADVTGALARRPARDPEAAPAVDLMLACLLEAVHHSQGPMPPRPGAVLSCGRRRRGGPRCPPAPSLSTCAPGPRARC